MRLCIVTLIIIIIKRVSSIISNNVKWQERYAGVQWFTLKYRSFIYTLHKTWSVLFYQNDEGEISAKEPNLFFFFFFPCLNPVYMMPGLRLMIVWNPIFLPSLVGGRVSLKLIILANLLHKRHRYSTLFFANVCARKSVENPSNPFKIQ